MSDLLKQEEIEEIFSYYNKQKDKNSQEMVVSLLRELQDVNGCIDSVLKKRVLETTNVTEKFLDLILKMYPSIKTTLYSHQITACTGARCGNKQAMEILTKLKKDLEIGKDGISKDGHFILKTRNCLKQCRTAPNIMIDDQLYSGDCVWDVKELMKNI